MNENKIGANKSDSPSNSNKEKNKFEETKFNDNFDKQNSISSDVKEKLDIFNPSTQKLLFNNVNNQITEDDHDIHNKNSFYKAKEDFNNR